MCGIIGYVGFRQAWPIVLEGLQRLEYRGYDSAGAVILDQPNPLEFHRSVGKVENLVAALHGLSPKGQIGLGHTRWATHGKPTLANTHPHTDCSQRVAVVHNGIVENFLDLKKDLLSQGHTFTSETDSEIIAHLIEEGLTKGEGFESAFTQMTPRIRGANAIVAIWQEEHDKILAVRLGNAGGFAVAHQDGETIIASDLPALTSFSSEVAFLEDGEIVTATSREVNFINQRGLSIPKRLYNIPQATEEVSKEGYQHFMLKEIMQQPQSLTSALRGQVDFQNGRVELENFPLSHEDIKGLRRIVLIGCGTSLHAAMVGRHLVESLSGIPAESDSSSEFRYRDTAIDQRTLVVSIGQSGETADTLAAMEAIKQGGGRLVTICNTEGSQATRLAEGTLYMRSGLEIGVASTKTFLASLSLLALLSLYVGQSNGFLNARTRRTILYELSRLPNVLGSILSDHTPYEELARTLCRYNHILYLGRGVNYPIAMEGALKLKEISYIHAEGYAGGEMKHGPIALIDENLATVALAPKYDLYEKMLNNIKEVKARDGFVIAVATEGDQNLESQVDEVVYIPEAPPLLTPFISVIPLQLLAYYVAIQRECDVDQPRNLAKSVTVE